MIRWSKEKFSSLFLFLFALLLFACTNQAQTGKKEETFSCPPSQEKVTVKRAIDGDTVELEGGEKLRYAAINSLELHTESGKPEPFAKEAYLRNKELTEGKSFCLEKAVRERDRYGRLLGELYFPNGTSVSELLLSEGLALLCHYEGSGKIFERLLVTQRKALSERKGLFSYVDKPEAKVNFIGNKHSKRFHHPQCAEAKNIKRKIIFKNLEEALYEGYCPSRECTYMIFPQ